MTSRATGGRRAHSGSSPGAKLDSDTVAASEESLDDEGTELEMPVPRERGSVRRTVLVLSWERMSSYDGIARFYDPWSRSVTEDVGFYVDQALASGGPVVELAVGTGRIAVPIAQAGCR